MELLDDIKEECTDNYTEKFIDIFHKTKGGESSSQFRWFTIAKIEI